MSFISYAQNFEDVMLWRALKHIDAGFYIDIGANHPSVDSVTKAFYDHGWRGISIEPLAQYHTALQQERPDDINLQCAVGVSEGTVNLFDCDVRGWATASQTVMKMHQDQGVGGELVQVPMLSLARICDEHVFGEIHFLKIDVEGFEMKVIQGADFKNFRPWIMVVEAHVPNTQLQNHAEWESLLVEADYLFAYSDGLNRFYVAEEHSDLMASFRYPPNVFDSYSLAPTVKLAIDNERLTLELEQVREQNVKLVQHVKSLEEHILLNGKTASSLEHDLSIAEGKVENYEQELEQAREQNVKLEQHVKSLEERILLNGKTASSLEHDLSIAEGKVENYEQELARTEKYSLLLEEQLQVGKSNSVDLRACLLIAEEKGRLGEQQRVRGEVALVELNERVVLQEDKIAKLEEAMGLQEGMLQDGLQRTDIVQAQLENLSKYAISRPAIQPQSQDLSNTTPDNLLGILVARHDHNFVDTAYKTIMHRAPDFSGLEYYLNMLRKGESKIEILGRLRFSPEGRNVGVKVSGLGRAFLLQRLYRMPVLGCLLQTLSAVFHLRILEKNQRLLENYLIQMLERDEEVMALPAIHDQSISIACSSSLLQSEKEAPEFNKAHTQRRVWGGKTPLEGWFDER